MKKPLLALILFTICFSANASFRQDDPFALVKKKLELYSNKTAQEKVYLHLDKPYYAIGDDIWFKAYVIDTRSTLPSHISNILYVELVNDRDSIKKQIRIRLENGIGFGDFKLTDSLNEGNYRIRAYTQWMRNAGASFFYDKTIKIGNSWANSVFTKSDFAYNKINDSEKLNATIQFTDKKGEPFVGRPVNYIFESDARTLSKGTTRTNVNGEIFIEFLNTMFNQHKKGRILATISIPNGKKIIKTIPIISTSSRVDVQFFPEGGHLVNTLVGKIGFKAVNSLGKGERVKGEIVDNNGLQLVQFESSNLGMGSVYFKPEPGMSYSARVTFMDGSTNTLKLPEAKNEGYILQVNNLDTSTVIIKALISAQLLNTGSLNLIGHQNGKVVFSSIHQGTTSLKTFSIKKKDLPSGIIQLTLFSPNNIPVCERIIFVNNSKDKLSLELNEFKHEYTSKELVNTNLKVTNLGKPVLGTFSIAVTDMNSIEPDMDNESNILTGLLLNGDVSGYIENPNYYFNQVNSEKIQALDNLLLTQGWRKIPWYDVMSDKEPAFTFPFEKDFEIKGSVISPYGAAIKRGKVSLITNTNGFQMLDTLTDESGRFVFNDLVFRDNVRFLIQARNEKNKRNVNIQLDTVARQDVRFNKNYWDFDANVNVTLSNYLQKSEVYFNQLTKAGLLSRTISVEEIVINGVQNLSPYSSNIGGAGNYDAIFLEKDLRNETFLETFLRGRVSGLIINGNTAYLNRNMSLGWGTQPMQIFVDGINIGTELDAVNVLDIFSIEVLKNTNNTSIYGTRGNGGVLVITTKRGGYVSEGYYQYAPGIISFTSKGYYLSRSFYVPKFDKSDDVADLRTTVYWNPNILTDNNGIANIQFNNLTRAGNYRLVLEGIDMEGNIGRRVLTYSIK